MPKSANPDWMAHCRIIPAVLWVILGLSMYTVTSSMNESAVNMNMEFIMTTWPHNGDSLVQYSNLGKRQSPINLAYNKVAGGRGIYHYKWPALPSLTIHLCVFYMLLLSDVFFHRKSYVSVTGSCRHTSEKLRFQHRMKTKSHRRLHNNGNSQEQ
jgi:hypothetical protein